MLPPEGVGPRGMGGYPPGHVGTQGWYKTSGPSPSFIFKMVSLRSGRETGRRARVLAKWRRVARAARVHARRERWERKQQFKVCWRTFAKGIRLQARREHMANVSTADQQDKCVVCYSKKTPVVNEVQLRMLQRLKDLHVGENTILYPFHTICCGQPLHLACYISFNRAQFLKRKDLWRCPNCRTMACANVFQGNFHLGTQDPFGENPNDVFIQWISTELPKNIQVFRVAYENSPHAAEIPFMNGTLMNY